jgi:prevent-host-death family protein
MAIVTIQEAKSDLSKLIARVEAGEDIVIARGMRPVVRLTLVAPAKRKLTFGAIKGEHPEIPASFFFDALPEDELKAWEGESEGPAL